MNNPLYISVGSHPRREEGMCLMEMVAYLAGEAHSDHPDCACPVLTAFAIPLNDSLPNDKRQDLLGMAVMLTASKSTPEIERQRAEYLIRQVVIRIVAPLFRGIGLNEADDMTAAAEQGTLEKLAASVECAAWAECAKWAARAARATSVECAACAARAVRTARTAKTARTTRTARAVRTARAARAVRADDEAVAILREALEIGCSPASQSIVNKAAEIGVPVEVS